MLLKKNSLKVRQTINKHPICLIIVIVSIVMLIFLSGAFAHRSGFLKTAILYFLSLPDVVTNYSHSVITRPAKLIIDIKYKDYDKLRSFRNNALQIGRLIKTDESYVPAKIRVDGQTVPVKIRLKGNLPDHYNGDKWSFRIKVKGDKSIYGMKRFSLLAPKRRGFIDEWIFFEMLRKEGLIALRYDFVDVTVNGKHLGTYALEESFSKDTLENNARREGPIIRFDESYLWYDGIFAGGLGQDHFTGWITQTDLFYSSDIDALESAKVERETDLRNQFHVARNLLDKFRKKNLPVASVFDQKKLATFFAIVDLIANPHALAWKNMRFYYNPIMSLLEPIGYNSEGCYELHTMSIHVPNIWYHVPEFQGPFFKDENFYPLYIAELDRLSHSDYLKQFFADISVELENKLAIIHKSYPLYSFSNRCYFNRQKQVHYYLHPNISIKAYYQSETNKVRIANTGYLPIELISIQEQHSLNEYAFHDTIRIAGRTPGDQLIYTMIEMPPDAKQEVSANMPGQFSILYQIPGTKRILSADIAENYHDDIASLRELLHNERKSLTHEMFHIDQASERIFIKKGYWKITDTLILPHGYELIAGPSTTIDLSNGASFITFSPITFVGTESNPMVIKSGDSTGQGLAVLGAERQSKLEFVIFHNLSNPSINAWQLTGAVTFYESPVNIIQTRFSNSRSEDALNLVRSRFRIARSLISQSQYDGLDVDFSNGQITESSFYDSANDAIELSGSTVALQSITVDGAGDSGLSAGEKSRVTVDHIELRNAAIGVASKDLSEISIGKLNISDGEIGITSYQKKSEYGPASINVANLNMDKVTIPYMVEEKSTLMVGKRHIKATQKKVNELLYGEEYGKSSK